MLLLYINNIVNDTGSTIWLFTEDTSLFIIVDDPMRAACCINTDLYRISNWTSAWLVTFIPSKTESLFKALHPPVLCKTSKYPKLTLTNILVSTFQMNVLRINT